MVQSAGPRASSVQLLCICAKNSEAARCIPSFYAFKTQVRSPALEVLERAIHKHFLLGPLSSSTVHLMFTDSLCFYLNSSEGLF